jgi:hypothetical protein
MRTLSNAFNHFFRRLFVSSCLALALFASSLSLSAGNSSLTVPVLTNSSLAQFTLNGDPNYSYAIQTSTDLQNWTPVLTNRTFIYQMPVSVPATNGSSYFRALALTNAPIPYLALGLAASSTINLNGKNFASDSFDSSRTNASTSGQYDPNKRLAGGGIGVNGAVVGDATVGNGNIYGHLFTGPGSVSNQVQIGPNGSVGPFGTVGGTIAPGWWSPTFNVSFPDVPVPSSIGLPPPAPILGTATIMGGAKYMTSGSYSPGTLRVAGPGTAQLWVRGSMSFGNILFTNGASLILYVGNTSGSPVSLTDSGSGVLNQPGLAGNLRIYGLPTLTSISMSGNVGFNATIYAPDADLTVGGGGSNVQDCSGAIVARSISLSGRWNFHYDESLGYFGSPF